ncbi:MAG: nicotinate-nucleotide--dimethylbenzimidazole phosphoribosyltransferase [Oscillospiraceae bacterium]|nr:nicotinate-nucleotide--dimethylbenzimidazole phosphoribosyltransferase [Oscillospiraceae bacterium]
MNERELRDYIAVLSPPDRRVMDDARARQARLAKPPGSLGALEDYAVAVAGITGQVCPTLSQCGVAVFAADNGVVAEGVSVTPVSVTWRQCVNMARHKTGMSALAHRFGDSVTVYDVGVERPLPPPAVDVRIRAGTGNIAVEPAMTRSQAVDAIAAGIRAARRAKEEGLQALGIGEMGIGNTTTAAAVLSALTGLPPEAVTGRGGGLTDAGLARKKQVIAGALARHQVKPDDVLDVLHKVGGLDIAAMCGAFLGCCEQRLCAVADGFISVVAALCAARLCPVVSDYLFLSHVSREIGYRAAAQALGKEPCLALGMRLGEGSGCVLMFRVLEAACAAMSDMATFEEAAIDDGYLAPIRNGQVGR